MISEDTLEQPIILAFISGDEAEKLALPVSKVYMLVLSLFNEQVFL